MLESVSSFAVQHLLEPSGLWALLALIPLIIVYLIRPRPKKQTIPALMFLMKEQQKADKTSFLRRLITDPLMFFQIILLIAFAIAIAKPFFLAPEDVFVERTALIIDVSASSQVSIDGETRFERTIAAAEENLGTKNTIILMGSIPEIVATDVSPAEAKSILSDLKPKDTTTAVFDAMVFAGNYVKPNDRVTVISDFIETATEKDFEAAKSILKSREVFVDMVDIKASEPRAAYNIGIIDAEVKEDTTVIQIRNYNGFNESIGIRMDGANLTIPELVIGPNDVEVVSFPTPENISRFFIVPYSGRDDFTLDNEVFISAPSEKKISLLLISNDITRHLATALDVIGIVDVQRSFPPQIPEISHQLIMYSNVQGDLVLPGTMKKLKKQVEEGAGLIVVGQEGILGTDFLGMLPVERASDSGPVMIKEAVQVIPLVSSSVIEDMNFGVVKQYLNLKATEGALVLAVTPDNSTVIAMKSVGKGMVVYFGLMDKYSDFKEDIYYPVFWKRLFEMITKKQDVSEMNFKTGKLVNLLERQTIITPFGKLDADTLVLTKQGVYKGESKIFVANLLDEKESDVSGKESGKKLGIFEDSLKNEEFVPYQLVSAFIIGLLVLVFIELLWIKFRGDL